MTTLKLHGNGTIFVVYMCQLGWMSSVNKTSYIYIYIYFITFLQTIDVANSY